MNGPHHIPSEPDTNETIPNRTPTSLRGSPYCRTSQVGAHAGTANTAITCNPTPKYRNPTKPRRSRRKRTAPPQGGVGAFTVPSATSRGRKECGRTVCFQRSAYQQKKTK